MTTNSQQRSPSSCESERLQQPTQTKTSSAEPTRWRSRSLSELPGHIRVPILKRKEPERMRERQEAAAAGLAELRQLREKQTALVLHTVAESNGPPRRKQFSYTESYCGQEPWSNPAEIQQPSQAKTLHGSSRTTLRRAETLKPSHESGQLQYDKRMHTRQPNYHNGNKHFYSWSNSSGNNNCSGYYDNVCRHSDSAGTDAALRVSNSRCRMSWDNLLHLAGLRENGQLESKDSGDSTNDQENVFGSEEAGEADTIQDNLLGVIPQRTGRSQSFCFGHASSLLGGRISENHSEHGFPPDNCGAATNDCAKEESLQARQSQKAHVATAILRRASIQCESVLTGIGTGRKKVMNPLHQIDLAALRSPGPLHAVTLQYNRGEGLGLDRASRPRPIPQPRHSVRQLGSDTFSGQTQRDADVGPPVGRQNVLDNKQLQPIYEDCQSRPHTDNGDFDGESVAGELGLAKQVLPLEDAETKQRVTNCEGQFDVSKLCPESTSEWNACASSSEAQECLDFAYSKTNTNENKTDVSTSSQTYIYDHADAQPADTSTILSDDGYSTCDSVSLASRLGPTYTPRKSNRIGHRGSYSSSDWSSLSSGSVSNLSLVSALSSSQHASQKRASVTSARRSTHPPDANTRLECGDSPMNSLPTNVQEPQVLARENTPPGVQCTSTPHTSGVLGLLHRNHSTSPPPLLESSQCQNIVSAEADSVSSNYKVQEKYDTITISPRDNHIMSDQSLTGPLSNGAQITGVAPHGSGDCFREEADDGKLEISDKHEEISATQSHQPAVSAPTVSQTRTPSYTRWHRWNRGNMRPNLGTKQTAV